MKKELKAARKKAGHSKMEAALKIGVSLSTIYRAENGNPPKHPFVKSAIQAYINRHNK